MSDIWEWFREKEWDYEEEGDKARLKVAQLHAEAMSYSETDPRTTIRMLKKGKGLARRLNEPWWVFLYDVWIAIVYKGDLEDVRQGLEHALHCVNEARKVGLQNHPWRLAAFNTLLDCYIKVDPYGYEGPIRSCLRDLAREIPPGPNEHRYVMMSNQRDFLLETGRVKQAEQVALRQFALFEDDLDGDEHYLINPVGDMCMIRCLQGNWVELQEYAERLEELTRHRDTNQVDFLEGRMWRALAVRKQGKEASARRLYRTIMTRTKDFTKVFEPNFHDAHAAFHEAGEDLEKALEVRDQQLQVYGGKGQVGLECKTHINRCTLLSRLGRLRQKDLDRAYAAAKPLKKPDPYLKQINRLARTRKESPQ